MKKLFIPAMLGIFVFLVSCSSKDELVFCPPLSAPVEGARAFVLTDEQKQTVDVRLNGVRSLPVRQQPVIAILSSGDELVEVGTIPKAGQLINSNSVFLSKRS